VIAMDTLNAVGLRPSTFTGRPKALVVDDDEAMLALLKVVLERAGVSVTSASSGPQALRLAYDHRPDVILLDIYMPEMDGLTLCQRLRELSDVPIIVVTACEGSESLTNAFASGADDYLTKPFDNAELLARIQACLRRVPKPVDGEDCIVLGQGELIINLRRHGASVRQHEVHLTRTEFDLLVYMARNRGRVLTHAMLKEAIWGEDTLDSTDCLKQFIGAIRRKIELDPRRPQWLVNEHGVGYILMLD